MPKFQLMPGATGLDLPDGRRLSVDRRGQVEVDDHAARDILGSAAYRRYDALLEVAPGRFFPTRADLVCACGFTPWPWQATCPRCGANLTAPEA